MRNAKQQSQDLQRTQEFIKALLSKEDIRGDASASPNPKLEVMNEPSKHIAITNGNLSFRGDPKARFSDPPAPPPQQPLPEKPDVPSLKRAASERPKLGTLNGVAIRPENVAHLQDALSTARKELTSQHTRLKDLEDKLREEQEARKTAEEVARRLEEAASTATEAEPASEEPKLNGAATHADDNALEEAFELGSKDVPADRSDKLADASAAEESAEAAFRTRIDAMMTEMEGLKKQLQLFRERAEKAEAERDADRETLADMVKRIRQRDADNAKLEAALAAATEAAAAAAAVVASAAASAVSAASSKSSTLDIAGNGSASSRSMSRGRSRSSTRKSKHANGAAAPVASATEASEQARGEKSPGSDDVASEISSLSRANTITPSSTALAKASRDAAIAQGIPYASMMGVVLIGMGLMAYLNGWQPTSRLDR